MSKGKDKLVDQMLDIAHTGDFTNIPLVDNPVKDALGMTRVATEAELEQLKRLKAKKLAESSLKKSLGAYESKAANLNDKFYQELIDRMKNGQPIDDMVSNYDPEAVRDILEEASGKYIKDKKGHPFDYFEKPELFKNTKITENPNLAEHGKFKYFEDPKTGLYLPDEGANIVLKNKGDLGTLLHEAQHNYDMASRPNVRQPLELGEKEALQAVKRELELPRKLASSSDLKGLEEATAYLGNHFKPDTEDKFGKLKQVLNLERLVQGKPLKMVAPLLKAAGVGALAASAAGIGNKAMAGDIKGAAGDALDLGTDLTPIVGEAKMALSPTATAEDSDKIREESFDFSPYRKLKNKLKSE